MSTTEHVHEVIVTSDAQNAPTPVLTAGAVVDFAAALSAAGAPSDTAIELITNSLQQPSQLRATFPEA